MLPGKEHWLPAADAARYADTDIYYFHKLIKAGEVEADFKQVGKIKKWLINPACPRYQKLLHRNAFRDKGAQNSDPQNETSVGAAGEDSLCIHSIDWQLWEDMCRAGEEIVRSRCSNRTISEYRRYATNFFKTYPELNRDSLRAALQVYEVRITRERDYYTPRRMLH